MFMVRGYQCAARLLVGVAFGAAALSGVARADVSLFTGIPGANSTVANPFTLQIDNGAGVLTTVNVTNIVGGGGPGADTAATKAAKIRAAIAAQAPVYPPRGILNQVTIGSTNRVRITSDPTKEKFDKLGNGIQYLAMFGGAGNATGFDALGQSAVVRMGIEGNYVAELTPTLGETPSSLMSRLASDLSSHGLGATFDSSGGFVRFDRMLSAGETFEFGNTDSGFNSWAESNGLVPSPGALALAACGGLLCARRRR